MSNIPFRVGQPVDVVIDGATKQAKVETYRIIGDRQIMTVRDHDGQAITLVVKLPIVEGGTAPIVVAPANIGIARTVALTMLSGHSTRLPVAAEANMLAAAVVALTGGAA
jgi:hypothetical protein